MTSLYTRVHFTRTKSHHSTRAYILLRAVNQSFMTVWWNEVKLYEAANGNNTIKRTAITQTPSNPGSHFIFLLCWLEVSLLLADEPLSVYCLFTLIESEWNSMVMISSGDKDKAKKIAIDFVQCKYTLLLFTESIPKIAFALVSTECDLTSKNIWFMTSWWCLLQSASRVWFQHVVYDVIMVLVATCVTWLILWALIGWLVSTRRWRNHSSLLSIKQRLWVWLKARVIKTDLVILFCCYCRFICLLCLCLSVCLSVWNSPEDIDAALAIGWKVWKKAKLKGVPCQWRIYIKFWTRPWFNSLSFSCSF